jgi:hypothetical protein
MKSIKKKGNQIYDSEKVLEICLSYNLDLEEQKKINAMTHEGRVIWLLDIKHFKFDTPKKDADDLEAYYRARERNLR